MKTEEKIGHYALELMKLETALHYAKRHVSLVENDIAKVKDTIKELKENK